MQSRLICLSPRKTASTSGKVVTIPIHEELYGLLLSVKPANAHGAVLPDYEERYLRDDASICDEIQGFFKRIGISVLKPGTGKDTGHRAVVLVGYHSFRHTWVSRAAEAGMDSASIRAVVGWGSPAMEKVYTHVSKEHLTDVFSRIPYVMTQTAVEKAATANFEVKSLSDEELEKLAHSVQSEKLQRMNSA